MKIKKESRGRPYKITSTEATVDGKRTLITFYRNKKNPKDFGNEIYRGKNYLVNDNTASYSRSFPKGKGLPKKYKVFANKLKKVS